MNEREAFLGGIRSIQRIIRLQAAKGFLETAAAIYLSLHTVQAVWLRFGASPSGEGLFVPAAIAISFLSASTVSIVRRKPFIRRLIDIDTRLHLQDRLSTAYEYIQKKNDSLFSVLLIADAGQTISRIDKRKLFPKKITRIHFLLAALIGVNLFMALAGYPSTDANGRSIPPATLDKIRAAVKTFTTAEDRTRRAEEIPNPDEVSKRITDLSRLLENPAVRYRQMTATLHKALKAVQGESIARARNLIEELGLHDLEDVSVQQIRRSDRLTAFQIRKLETLVKRLFDDQAPRAVSDELGDINRQRRLAAQLEQLIEALEKDRFKRTAPGGTVLEKSEGTVAGRAQDRQPPENANHPTPSGKNPATGTPGTPAGAEPAGGGGDDGPGDIDGESRQQGPSAAGHGKGRDQSEPAYRPNPIPGPGLQDKTATSRSDEFSALIRSLTAAGTARSERRPVIRSYRQSVESILQKENIPLNYKQYIRNYFLSIGLRKEPPTRGRYP